MTVAERLLVGVFRHFPTSDTPLKAPEGRPSTEYEDEVRLPIYKWVGESADLFAGKDVLDLGSGYGGRAVRFLDYGARSLVGVEITEQIVERGRAFAQANEVHDRVTFRLGTGEQIPAADGEFDLVLMFDVMEHVISPREVMSEIHRVLRPGGKAAIVFPPYYALRGGSHLHGYATSFPGLNLFFPTATLRRAVAIHLDQQGVDWRSNFRDAPTDKLWTQNGLTARAFRRLVDECDFEPIRIRYTSHFENRRLSRPLRPIETAAYHTFRLLAQPPLLREAFCERVCALLRRP